MCRNIRTLFNFEPPATEEEIRASALQFVRKLSGFNVPSKANEDTFNDAVEEVSDAARRILEQTEATIVLATPLQFSKNAGSTFFGERIGGSSIQVIEGETSDTLAHADVAIAASGTVTIEAAILGTPMVTFYKVAPLSWTLGRFLVRVPFYSMVNLVAGRRIVPELMQDQASGENLAAEAIRLLEEAGRRIEMKQALAEVVSKLASCEHPMDRAARIVSEYLKRPEK